MMAAALENNGATVYILGRRLDVLEKAAKDSAVSIRVPGQLKTRIDWN